MNAARTTFIIAHRITSVMHADLILVLDNGRIVQRGTHHTLINQPGIYQRTYQLQAQIEQSWKKSWQRQMRLGFLWRETNVYQVSGAKCQVTQSDT